MYIDACVYMSESLNIVNSYRQNGILNLNKPKGHSIQTKKFKNFVQLNLSIEFLEKLFEANICFVSKNGDKKKKEITSKNCLLVIFALVESIPQRLK